ncbi:hypothetical protein NLI96_g9391 [Meripilus lineatus]|uniref:Uncharacterized protein n=1 Tax=Meripilus lineatus TaxID=2056292 RepID=A0AAD5UX54_9APHY|nr:hypothetical protein NLI96_g9391 [Physisporinus lineatus]
MVLESSTQDPILGSSLDVGSNSFRPGITIPHLNCPGISFTLYILLHDIVDFMNPMILSSLKNKVGLPNVVIKALTILSSRINIIAQS